MVFRSAFVPALDAPSVSGSLHDAAVLLKPKGGTIRAHHVVDSFRPPVSMADAVEIASIVESQRNQARRLQAEVREAFEEIANTLEPRISTHFTTSEGDMPRAAALAARLADVIVFRNRGEKRRIVDPVFLEELIFHSGRPLFLVPEGGLDHAPDRLAVAWNGSREAARALALAEPLVRSAKKVAILTVGREERGTPGGEELAEHLRRCGFSAEVHRRDAAAAAKTTAALAEMAKDAGCGALVLGAFSHSRLRQVVLGGVTRTVLEEPPMPLLIAH